MESESVNRVVITGRNVDRMWRLELDAVEFLAANPDAIVVRVSPSKAQAKKIMRDANRQIEANLVFDWMQFFGGDYGV